MNTQNVKVKTATEKSSKRWGENPETRQACIIAEQRTYLAELCQVLQLSQQEEREESLRLLGLMADNVCQEGVLLPAGFISCRPAVATGERPCHPPVWNNWSRDMGNRAK